MNGTGSRQSPKAASRWRRWMFVAVATFLVVVALGVWMGLRDPLILGGAAVPSHSTTPASGAGRPGDTDPSGGPAPAVPDDAPDPEASPAPMGPPATGGTERVEKPPAVEDHAFDDEARVATQLVVEVVSVDAVVAGRDIPGEVSGPAVTVEIQVENVGTSAVDTSGASVNLTYGDDDRLPAPPVLDDSVVMLPASLAPGATAIASYTFSVPLDPAGNVRIMVDILAEEPDVVFTGPRP